MIDPDKCPKCGSESIVHNMPWWPGWECMDCGHTWDPAAPGIPVEHMPAIWRITKEAREQIMEATGLELAVEARIEDIRTSHRGRAYVRH